MCDKLAGEQGGPAPLGGKGAGPAPLRGEWAGPAPLRGEGAGQRAPCAGEARRRQVAFGRGTRTPPAGSP